MLLFSTMPHWVQTMVKKYMALVGQVTTTTIVQVSHFSYQGQSPWVSVVYLYVALSDGRLARL